MFKSAPRGAIQPAGMMTGRPRTCVRPKANATGRRRGTDVDA